MFYDVFKKLCDDRGINPTRASVEIGFTKTHRYELFWFRNVFGLTIKLPQR